MAHGRKEAGVKLVTGFESQLHTFAEVTSLIHGFLISKVGIIILICSKVLRGLSEIMNNGCPTTARQGQMLNRRETLSTLALPSKMPGK